MIPKTIHYCWFGRNQKPELAEKCIKSWKIYCPDYEVIEWNEDNFDLNSAPLYVQQAYEAKKWAFVTDYVRLWAMVEFGGIYMDTDVEVIKPLDRFLKHKAFAGFEDNRHIQTAIMACEKSYPFFEKLLRIYDGKTFFNPDGSMDLTTNVSTITEMCLKNGLKQNGEHQIIQGFALYPKDFFCPLSFSTGWLRKTKNTVTVHWFAGSWHDQEQKQYFLEQVKAERTDYIRHLPNRMLRKVLGYECYERLKKRLKK